MGHLFRSLGPAVPDRKHWYPSRSIQEERMSGEWHICHNLPPLLPREPLDEVISPRRRKCIGVLICSRYWAEHTMLNNLISSKKCRIDLESLRLSFILHLVLMIFDRRYRILAGWKGNKNKYINNHMWQSFNLGIWEI